MPGPSWLPTRPTWMPAWDEIYKVVIPGLWPRRMVKSGGAVAKDIETKGHGLSWVREAVEWVLHAFFPSADSEELLLGRWEEALGIMDPPPTQSGRAARIEAALRQRHTMTEDQVKAIMSRAWGHTDPTRVLFAYPTPTAVAAGSHTDLDCVKQQNYLHIYDSTGAEPDLALADDLIRRIKPAWQRWSVGSHRSLKYGDGSGDHDTEYRWGRATIGNG